MGPIPTSADPNVNSAERINSALLLDQAREKIMSTWETRVRESITSAPSKSVLALRNQIPDLLENLVFNISPHANISSFAGAGKIGKSHGGQRAGLLDYTCSQVLLEYRMLRQVIFEVLEETKLLTFEIRDIILNVLDEGIEKAIEQFSLVRSEELNRSNRDLQHFAAIAAHDLKSPLATITGFTELLYDSLREKVEIEEASYLQAIKRSSARMTLLIDRLLDYSSVGLEIKPFENLSLNRAVKDVLENLKSAIEKNNAKIFFNDLPIVYGDASLLSQLVQNFISNAIKFRAPQRALEIHIDAKEDGLSWLVCIRDNGVGFDPKNKEDIFSLFKRLDGTKAQIGLGIGLATVRKVIELHGGKVWAESEPGIGSSFFFTLPKAKD